MHSTLAFLLLSLITLVRAVPVAHPFSHHAFAKRDGNAKAVFSHFMMGNAFPYGQADFERDVKLAAANGIDAFALNIGKDDWQPAHVQFAYDAAAASGTNLKMFISFDMTVLPCNSPDDAAALRKYITTYANHPAQYKYDGRVFASTFAGQDCTFGAGSTADGWRTQFTEHPELTGNNAVFFVPSFFVDPATFGQFNGVLDGYLNWNGGWPTDLTSGKVSSLLSNIGVGLGQLLNTPLLQKATTVLSKFVGTVDADTPYINGLKSVQAKGAKAFLTTVSPLFFTHYGPNSFNKNFVYYSDNHLYATRWENIIKNRNAIDLVEINTWNDYGESHYIAPVTGAQPDSQAWVDGFPHDGFLDMTSYYATAFKTGSFPAITEDKIYLWSRPHTVDANPPDSVGKPTNSDTMTDAMWALIFSTSPATITLTTSPTHTQTFQVPSGVSKLSVPIEDQGVLHGTMTRDGKTVVDLEVQGFRFTDKPDAYNFNMFVAYKGANSK
ncbi:glycoside hydrolase family 71 protein [Panus rudis PR-1116 ss-1]|nr:glycoside hydrolase family 71 protein [Panus rudis PR-1116 ss-1]